MEKKTILLIVAAVSVAGVTFWLWRRGKGAMPALSIPTGPPMLLPAQAAPVLPPATAAQIAAGAWQDETGWHIPAAVRTPDQQRSALAAEIASNSVRRF